jgi:hypothetical protein
MIRGKLYGLPFACFILLYANIVRKLGFTIAKLKVLA